MKRWITVAMATPLAWAVLTSQVFAQTPTPSFSLLGHIEALDVDDLTDPFSSGTMTVNGLKIILPRNLLIVMPGQYLTLNDIFRGAKPGKAPALSAAVKPSGIALKDIPRPAMPYEAQLIGNVVGGRYIAGWARFTQQDLNVGAGFIKSIDYAKGELLVGALDDPDPAAGAKVRINDPDGVYGKKNADKFAGSTNSMDERFAVDPGNAPVHAETGFPMCIPRVAPPASDPLCPVNNRAPAPNTSRFTCGPVAAEATSPSHAGCVPAAQAPLMAGDYIAYSGTLLEEPAGSGNFFMAAYSIGANTGIYTSPNADPAYVLIEESLVGTLGAPYAGVDQEQTSRFKIVGFATDPSRDVDVFSVDINPATGAEQERLLTTLTPSKVAQIGRFRITLPSKANFLPVTRDTRIRIKDHTSVKVAGGLDSGQYTAPVNEYIYPENTRFGQRIPPTPRAFPVSVPFENFCFLKNNGGKLTTLGRDGSLAIGALAPFPLSGHPNAQARTDGTLACP